MFRCWFLTEKVRAYKILKGTICRTATCLAGTKQYERQLCCFGWQVTNCCFGWQFSNMASQVLRWTLSLGTVSISHIKSLDQLALWRFCFLFLMVSNSWKFNSKSSRGASKAAHPVFRISNFVTEAMIQVQGSTTNSSSQTDPAAVNWSLPKWHVVSHGAESRIWQNLRTADWEQRERDRKRVR